MKSEKAKQFIDDDLVVMNNGDRMVDASTAYMAVDIAERELTRWHDPEILPTDERRVIVKAQLPNRAEFITGGWYAIESHPQGWSVDLDREFRDLM